MKILSIRGISQATHVKLRMLSVANQLNMGQTVTKLVDDAWQKANMPHDKNIGSRMKRLLTRKAMTSLVESGTFDDEKEE